MTSTKLRSEEYLEASSLFELPEGGTPPFTSLESYEYASDSDLDDEEGGKLAAVQPAEELAGGGEASACHDEQSHTAQTQGGLSVCALSFPVMTL